MKALITGVGGFCGTRLVSRLRTEGNVEIAGLDRMALPESEIVLERYFRADVTDGDAVESAIRAFGPDCVFHLAGISGSSVPTASIYQVNVMGAMHLLEAIRRNVPNCAVLLVGSSAEYGPVESADLPVREETRCQPVGAYGVSKYAATLIAIDYSRRFGLKVVIARPSNIVGPGVPQNLVVGALLVRAKQALASLDPLVKVGDFDSERDFVDVADVVDAYVRLIRSEARGEIFNICSGRAYSVKHVAETLLANSTRPISIEFDPQLVPPSAIRSFHCSYEKAERTIGFRPSISLAESLKACWLHEMGIGVECV